MSASISSSIPFSLYVSFSDGFALAAISRSCGARKERGKVGRAEPIPLIPLDPIFFSLKLLLVTRESPSSPSLHGLSLASFLQGCYTCCLVPADVYVCSICA
ncbi:hypothetical protein GW17_00042999 [Ensete ventricosum]|nr:hypothetical protein GW17_00042999 [Ensete ventricosum]RZR95853.1 hypothetical protein BHM03_00024745 [Ensete ventricosum]